MAVVPSYRCREHENDGVTEKLGFLLFGFGLSFGFIRFLVRSNDVALWNLYREPAKKPIA